MTLIPRKCGNVSPQCPVGQERGYRLGWYQGQIAMADEYDGTPCRVIELESEIERLRLDNERRQKNGRDHFAALCAMRNDLNAMLPIQHLEADLRDGPETSVFCAVVVEAVRTALATAEPAKPRTITVSDLLAEELKAWAEDERASWPGDTAFQADLADLLAQISALEGA